MQFQCGSCGFYKNQHALQKHLGIKHKIYITLTRAIDYVRNNKGKRVYLKDYKGKMVYVTIHCEYKKDTAFYYTLHDLYIHSNKRYVCYNCEGIQFKSLPQTLHHLDKVHNIHISYIKGISKKIVFLDGI